MPLPETREAPGYYVVCADGTPDPFGRFALASDAEKHREWLDRPRRLGRLGCGPHHVEAHFPKDDE